MEYEICAFGYEISNESISNGILHPLIAGIVNGSDKLTVTRLLKTSLSLFPKMKGDYEGWIMLLGSNDITSDITLSSSLPNNKSWVRRYVILRGSYLFYFHAKSHNQPIGVIPLEGCMLTNSNEYLADGFALDIIHSIRGSMTLLFLNDYDRNFFFKILKPRCQRLLNISDSKLINLKRQLPHSNKAILTEILYSDNNNSKKAEDFNENTKLLDDDGVSVLTNKTSSVKNGKIFDIKSFSKNMNVHQIDDNNFSKMNINSSHTDDEDTDLLNSTLGSLRQQSVLGKFSSKSRPSYPSFQQSSSLIGHYPNHNYNIDNDDEEDDEEEDIINTGLVSAVNELMNENSPTMNTDNNYINSNGNINDNDSSNTTTSVLSTTNNNDNNDTINYNHDSDPNSILHSSLNQNDPNLLEIKNSNTQLSLEELGTRLAKSAKNNRISMKVNRKSVNVSRSATEIEAKRLKEAENPLRLSTMLRYCLFSSTEEMIDVAGDAQFPILKGHWSNTVMTCVFEAYSQVDTTTGLRGMKLIDLIHFCDDLDLIHTHVPIDENGNPDNKYVTLLSPAELISSIPKGLGYRRDVLIDYMDDPRHEGNILLEDDVYFNFTQFYHVILQMSRIVYPNLIQEKNGTTIATNKLVQEAIVPLYVWQQNYHQLGCIDPLLTDRKVLLILISYAPNLWKVFTTYGQFLCSIKAEGGLNIRFPEGAKCSERAQFGVPSGAPFDRMDAIYADPTTDIETYERMLIEPSVTEKIIHQAWSIPITKLNNEGIVIVEGSILKMFADYGIQPNLTSKKELKEYFYKCNSKKLIEAIPVSPMAATAKGVRSPLRVSPTKTSKTNINNNSNSNCKDDDSKSEVNDATTVSMNMNTSTGLAFTEFLECLALVANSALDSPAYRNIFPTPYSRVLALLTIWGFADLNKLEEINLMNASEILNNNDFQSSEFKKTFNKSNNSSRSNSRNTTPSSSPIKSSSKNNIRVGTSTESPSFIGSPKKDGGNFMSPTKINNKGTPLSGLVPNNRRVPY